jgi:DNA-nicking Smr family endonuclease
MTAPRGLSADERAAWERLAATVTPLQPTVSPPLGEVAVVKRLTEGERLEPRPAKPVAPSSHHHASRGPPPPRGEERAASGSGLDSHWDRKFQAGRIEPDFTLDLHGHTLDSAHARLDDGLFQAKAMGARVVLLIAGKPRPVDAADRGTRRGAIRAKVLDWLAAGPHGSDIAAVRKAHRRHGGEGALYLILKRRR